MARGAHLQVLSNPGQRHRRLFAQTRRHPHLASVSLWAARQVLQALSQSGQLLLHDALGFPPAPTAECPRPGAPGQLVHSPAPAVPAETPHCPSTSPLAHTLRGLPPAASPPYVLQTPHVRPGYLWGYRCSSGTTHAPASPFSRRPRPAFPGTNACPPALLPLP